MRCVALVAVTALVAGVAGNAFAADLPLKAPPRAMPAPAFNWTGFYIGAHAGYSWGSGTSTYVDPALAAFDINMKPKGFLGGVQAGYNHQFSNNVVLGIEADVSWADITDSIPYTLAAYAMHGPNTISSKTDYAGSIRGRLGYAFGQVMPYLTGGYAVAHASITATDGPLHADATYRGWVFGGGAEYAATKNVSIKAEYLHSEFGSHTYFEGAAYASTSTPTSDTVRVGINFRP
jgi:outer membrane immunogenic protein